MDTWKNNKYSFYTFVKGFLSVKKMDFNKILTFAV